MPALTGRIRQLIEAMLPGDPRPCTAFAASVLSPPLLDLFQSMAVFDRQHGCRVARDLAASGWTSGVAAEAALLHDVGKSCGTARVRLPDRVALVVLRAIPGGKLARRAAAAGGGLGVAWRHQAIGAACLRERGADPYAVWLVGNHERRDLAGDPLLAALIAADGGLIAGEPAQARRP